jgi:hypothetical protein
MHDNTCKTNRYNRPLSIFVTSDNNLKTRIVAQAIVDDETQFSYEWVFQCVKEATSISPRVFVTDSDPAVSGAVATQFPDTFHMHCIWHIGQNLPKQLKGKLGSNFDNFTKDFYTTRNGLTEKQFNKRYTYCVMELLKFIYKILLLYLQFCHSSSLFFYCNSVDFFIVIIRLHHFLIRHHH